jgi:pyruvate,water dikinase
MEERALSDDGQMDGIGASDGMAQGPARWVRTESDVDMFDEGCVLLARMTSPDWLAVYQRAAAVVTAEGGMLCHAAIVAREEGIPAVVGLGAAIDGIRNGQTVSVNGTQGNVTVYSS